MNTYVVQENEQLNDIANKLGVKVEDILAINGEDLSNLKAGQKINVPVKINKNFDYYVVKKGDTLYSIANANNIDLEILSEINGIEIYDYLYPGQIIMVPKKGTKAYITKLGDTLEKIASMAGVNPKELLDYNETIYLLPEQMVIYKQQ